MKLTRRAFFQGLVASVATVAIALRMAPKFLPDSLLNTGTWRYEQATDKYFYGVDLAKPWEIQIFEQTDFHDPESWKLMDPSELMQRAYESLVKEVGVDQDTDEAMEAASIIAMSQGFAALKVEGGPHIINGDYGISADNLEEMDVDVFAVPTIYTTKEELFRHG